MMLGLGPFRFSLNTAAYQEFAHTTQIGWQEQARIGRKPAMQCVGPNLDEISLKGVIYPEFRGGFQQVENMRTAARLGPLSLVDGTGRIYGQFVIMQIQETKTIFYKDGTPRKIEFALDLKEYGADGQSGTELNINGLNLGLNIGGINATLNQNGLAASANIGGITTNIDRNGIDASTTVLGQNINMRQDW